MTREQAAVLVLVRCGYIQIPSDISDSAEYARELRQAYWAGHGRRYARMPRKGALAYRRAP